MDYDEEMSLDSIASKCINSNSTKKWSKLFKQAAENNYKIVKERNEYLKKRKDGTISPDNFDWSEGGTIKQDDDKSIELTPQETTYKQENEEMFGPTAAKGNDWLGDKPKAAPQRNPNNPYLTKAEKQMMASDKSGEEIDATEKDDDSVEPNPYEQVKIRYSSEHGLVVTIGDKSGCISKEEIPQLIEYAQSAADGLLDDSDEDEEDDEEDEEDEEEPDAESQKENDEENDEPEHNDGNAHIRLVKISSSPGGFSSFANELARMM